MSIKKISALLLAVLLIASTAVFSVSAVSQSYSYIYNYALKVKMDISIMLLMRKTIITGTLTKFGIHLLKKEKSFLMPLVLTIRILNLKSMAREFSIKIILLNNRNT